MATECTATDLVSAGECFQCMTPRQLGGIQILLLCAAANGDTMECDPATLLSAATSAGYLDLSPQQQMVVQTYLMCAIANNGGGGGGGATQVFCGNYSAGTPSAVPTTSCAIAVDTSNGTVWYYYGSAWH